MDVITLISIVSFLVILVFLVVLREKSGKNLEIKTPDLMLALIVPALILFASGKIESLQFGDLKVQSALVNAAETKVEAQVNRLETGVPVEAVSEFSKRGVREIPNMIKLKTEVLTFVLGQGNYYGPAIDEYLTKLLKTPDFKYLLITEDDGSFWGLTDARKLMDSSGKYINGLNAQKLALWLNKSRKSALKVLPGFISRDQAVSQFMNKSEVLQTMENIQVDQLPAINDKGNFMGMVDRTRILASMILDVTSQLKK